VIVEALAELYAIKAELYAPVKAELYAPRKAELYAVKALTALTLATPVSIGSYAPPVAVHTGPDSSHQHRT
jgi:hypothetical protein